jgi:N-acetylneuraminate 9-O-acetyltransferase
MAFKFFALTGFTMFLWDVPGVFDFFWAPLKPFLAIDGSLHEWHFRSKLDHLIAIWGMLCAYNYPAYSKWLLSLEAQAPSRQLVQKSILAVACVAVLLGWTYWAMFVMEDRFAYNKWHPYTAFLPITAYLLLRNLTPWLRNQYLPGLAFVGKMTLETYLLQFHLFLANNAKSLADYLPGYPLLTFIMATAFLATFGYIAFQGTVTVSDWLMPRPAPGSAETGGDSKSGVSRLFFMGGPMQRRLAVVGIFLGGATALGLAIVMAGYDAVSAVLACGALGFLAALAQ